MDDTVSSPGDFLLNTRLTRRRFLGNLLKTAGLAAVAPTLPLLFTHADAQVGQKALQPTVDQLAVQVNGVANAYLDYFLGGILRPLPDTPRPYVGPHQPAGEALPHGVLQYFQAQEVRETFDGKTTAYDRYATTEGQGNAMRIALYTSDYGRFNTIMAANQKYFQRQNRGVYHNGYNTVSSPWHEYDFLHAWKTGQKSGTATFGKLTGATATDGDLNIIGCLLAAHERVMGHWPGWQDALESDGTSLYLKEARRIMADFHKKCIHLCGGKRILSDSAGQHPSTHPTAISSNITYYMPWQLRLMAKWTDNPQHAKDFQQVVDDFYDHYLPDAIRFTSYNVPVSFYSVDRRLGKLTPLLPDSDRRSGFSNETVRMMAYLLEDAYRSGETRGLHWIRLQAWLDQKFQRGEPLVAEYDRNGNPRAGKFIATRTTYSYLIAHLAVTNPSRVNDVLNQTLSRQFSTSKTYWAFPHDPFLTFITWDNLHWAMNWLREQNGEEAAT